MFKNKVKKIYIVSGIAMLVIISFVGSYLKKENEFKQWETYKNEKYGFEIQHPPNSNMRENNEGKVQYIRIQNYEEEDLPKYYWHLSPGQYYLELFIYDHKLGHKNPEPCPGQVSNPTKVFIGEGITAYKGKGIGGGDSTKYAHAICAISEDADYYIQASENGEALIGKIIDSVRFTK